MLKKKRKGKLKEEGILKNIKNKLEAWTFINKYRGRREIQEENKISGEE